MVVGLFALGAVCRDGKLSPGLVAGTTTAALLLVMRLKRDGSVDKRTHVLRGLCPNGDIFPPGNSPCGKSPQRL